MYSMLMFLPILQQLFIELFIAGIAIFVFIKFNKISNVNKYFKSTMLIMLLIGVIGSVGSSCFVFSLNGVNSINESTVNNQVLSFLKIIFMYTSVVATPAIIAVLAYMHFRDNKA